MIRISLTNEQRNLEPIGSAFCKHYQTEARFSNLAVTATHGSLPSSFPHDWSNETLLKFLHAPSKKPNVPYPTWEVPARVHGRPVLFDF